MTRPQSWGRETEKGKAMRLLNEMERERDRFISRASGYSMTGERVLASKCSLAACALQAAIKAVDAATAAEGEAASRAAEA